MPEFWRFQGRRVPCLHVEPTLDALRGQLPRELLSALASDASGLPSASATVNDVGAYVAATLYLANQATNGQKVTIGGYEFHFVSALSAQTTYAQVLIGASVAADLQTLAHAINGVADAHVVQAYGGFPLALRAIDYGAASEMYLFAADAPGGNPIVTAAPSVALSTNITNGEWDVANLNAYGTSAPATRRVHRGSFTITAEMMTFGVTTVWVPFQPSFASVVVRDPSENAYVVRSNTWDVEANPGTVAVGPNWMLTYILPGGDEPSAQIGDVVYFLLVE